MNANYQYDTILLALKISGYRIAFEKDAYPMFDILAKSQNEDFIAIELLPGINHAGLSKKQKQYLRLESEPKIIYLITDSVDLVRQSSGSIPYKIMTIQDFIAEITGASLFLTVENKNLQKELLAYSVRKTKSDFFASRIGSVVADPSSFDEVHHSLHRQFSTKMLDAIAASNRSLDETLYFGQKYPKAVCVVLDIKNFSLLMHVLPEALVHDAFLRFYRKSRELVWHYDGMLDKFIGDSVLGVFNYPFNDPDSLIGAVLFGFSVIQLWGSIFQDIEKHLDNAITTGIRVGISQGDLFVLNIGVTAPEVAFIGGSLNLAARLESNSEVNGLLISNVFKNSLYAVSEPFVDLLVLQQVELESSHVKGAIGTTKVWRTREIFSPNHADKFSCYEQKYQTLNVI